MEATLAERTAQDMLDRQAAVQRWVVNGIVALNMLVFAGWKLATTNLGAAQSLQEGFGFDVSLFMQENFLVGLGHLEDGRIWTLVTSVFSHAQLFHLAINMLVLKSFAPPIARVWGVKTFLVFYVSAGVAASVAHVLFSWFGWPDIPALGASGAIAGLLLAYAFMYPQRRVYLFALFPLPAWFMAVAFVGLDLWGLIGQYGNIEMLEGQGVLVGHGAHLGGALFGVIWSLLDRSQLDDLHVQEQAELDADEESSGRGRGSRPRPWDFMGRGT